MRTSKTVECQLEHVIGSTDCRFVSICCLTISGAAYIYPFLLKPVRLMKAAPGGSEQAGPSCDDEPGGQVCQ